MTAMAQGPRDRGDVPPTGEYPDDPPGEVPDAPETVEESDPASAAPGAGGLASPKTT